MIEPVGHLVSRSSLRAVARGDAGPDVLRQLSAARRSRDLVLLHRLVRSAAQRRHPDAEATVIAYRRLTDLQRLAPAAVEAVLHYPSVSAWALYTVRALDGGRPELAQPGRLAAVAAAAAVRGRVPGSFLLDSAVDPAPGGTELVTLPSVGTAALPAGPVRLDVDGSAAMLTASSVRLNLDQSDGDRWAGVPLLRAEHAGQVIELRLDTFIAPSRLAVDQLRDWATIGRWREYLTQAWRSLVHRHPLLAVELTTLLTVLAPIAGPAGGFAASTPNDAFGCVAMSPPRDVLELTSNLAHELQHVKLTAVTELVALTRGEGTTRFYAPWRPDPRPALGMLHGVYAHLGVVAFWVREWPGLTGASALRAEVELTRWKPAALDAGRDLMSSGELTRPGREFLGQVLSALAAQCTDGVTAQAAELAERLRTQHQTQWRREHGTASTRSRSADNGHT